MTAPFYSSHFPARRNGWFIPSALALVLALLGAATPARALVIIPVWDSTITNDPNATIIESTINSAIQFYETRFAAPITTSIQFEEMSGGTGESQYVYYTIPYSQFYAALQLNATTANASNAVANLPAGPNNPVTGDANINVHTAHLKALGFDFYPSGLPGGIDGYVLLNTSEMNLSRASNNPSKVDLLSVAEHEMDEVLAFGSELPNSGEPFPQDLFRYTSAGARTFTTNGDDAYFSINGTNLLVQFNQQLGLDFGDWWVNGAHTPRVQDAASTAGATPNPTVELIGLDVIGFRLVPPPQPGILSIAISGTNLALTGINGLATGVYHLLASTNLALPLSQWQSVATNALTTNGNFAITATNAVKPKSTAQFYVLQLQ
jgi:hypothetical protein